MAAAELAFQQPYSLAEFTDGNARGCQALDAHFMTTGDPKSSWTKRRLSHQNLAIVFLVALLLDRISGVEGRAAGVIEENRS